MGFESIVYAIPPYRLNFGARRGSRTPTPKNCVLSAARLPFRHAGNLILLKLEDQDRIELPINSFADCCFNLLSYWSKFKMVGDIGVEPITAEALDLKSRVSSIPPIPQIISPPHFWEGVCLKVTFQLHNSTALRILFGTEIA